MRALHADTTGSLLPMAAISLTLLLLMAGAGVDFSRAYVTKTRLQAACDAGALAGRRAVTTEGFNNAAEVVANNYFDANFNPANEGLGNAQVAFTSPDSGSTVVGNASGQMSTYLLPFAGIDTIDVSANCTSTMSVGNSDVTMVLDTTGSMRGSRIAALRTAMKNFYDTVATATQGSNARIRYAFVPYSSSVNVGTLIRDVNPDFLRDDVDVQSRKPIFEDITGDGAWQLYSGNSYSKKKTCNNAKPDNTGTTSYRCTKYAKKDYRIEFSTQTTTEQFTGFNYTQVNWDVSNYKTGGSLLYLNDSGNETSTTWDGCIEERSTVVSNSFSYNSLTGYSPSGATDLDIDTAPDVSDDNTKWSPMIGAVAYRRTDSRGNIRDVDESTFGRNTGDLFYVCPNRAQLLSTMSQGDFYDYADDLNTAGYTFHDIGAIWGGRLSSPDGIFANNVNEVPDNGGEVSRHMIFMTDGQMDADNEVYTSYGIEFHDRRTTTNGAQNNAAHTARFLAVCQAIRSKGIRLWVIAFGTGLTNDLRTCASNQSAFTAANASDLNEAFQEIAKQVGELRITN
ncbi:MAG: TadE/TadG family type IV pilus assembly protein [Caenibius sp.]